MKLYILLNESTNEFKIGITNNMHTRVSYWLDGLIGDSADWVLHAVYSGHESDVRATEAMLLNSTASYRTTGLFQRSSGRYNSGYSEVRDTAIMDQVMEYLDGYEWLTKLDAIA